MLLCGFREVLLDSSLPSVAARLTKANDRMGLVRAALVGPGQCDGLRGQRGPDQRGGDAGPRGPARRDPGSLAAERHAAGKASPLMVRARLDGRWEAR